MYQILSLSCIGFLLHFGTLRCEASVKHGIQFLLCQLVSVGGIVTQVIFELNASDRLTIVLNGVPTALVRAVLFVQFCVGRGRGAVIPEELSELLAGYRGLLHGGGLCLRGLNACLLNGCRGLCHGLCAAGDLVQLFGGQLSLRENDAGQLGKHVPVSGVGEVQLVDVGGLHVLTGDQALNDLGLLLCALLALLALSLHEAQIQGGTGVQHGLIGVRCLGLLRGGGHLLHGVAGRGGDLLGFSISLGHSLVNTLSRGLDRGVEAGVEDRVTDLRTENSSSTGHEGNFATLCCGLEDFSAVCVVFLRWVHQQAESFADRGGQQALGLSVFAKSALVGDGHDLLSAFLERLSGGVLSESFQHVKTGNELLGKVGGDFYAVGSQSLCEFLCTSLDYGFRCFLRHCFRTATQSCVDKRSVAEGLQVEPRITHLNEGGQNRFILRCLSGGFFIQTIRHELAECGAAHSVV